MKIVVAMGVALLAHAAATQAASSEAAEQAARNAMQLDANATRGAALYRSECVRCHGEAAQGDVTRLIPALAGQRRAYLLKQLADFNAGDREGNTMHEVAARSAVREPQAWADLAQYLNGQPLVSKQAGSNSKMAGRGKRAYERWCVSCHEADARGDDEGFVPALRHQLYPYLLKQMQALSAQHRSNVEPDMMRVLDSLSSEEMAGIADYLARMSGPVRERERLQQDGTLSK